MGSSSPPRFPKWLKLAVILAAAGGTVAATWWFAPGLSDRLVYGEVNPRCWGRLVVAGEVESVEVAGRHCRSGGRLNQNEEGFLVTFEYARDGRVLLWGRGQGPTEPGAVEGLDLAMIRTPGDAGTWLCAGQASWSIDDSGEYQVNLHQVGVVLREAELESAGGTLKAGEDQIELEIGQWLATVPINGAGCDQDSERCDFQGDNERAIRAFVRSEGPDSEGYAFVLRENQRAASEVQLSVSADAKPTLEPMKSLELRELSEWVSCPLPTPGEGEITLRWKP